MSEKANKIIDCVLGSELIVIAEPEAARRTSRARLEAEIDRIIEETPCALCVAGVDHPDCEPVKSRHSIAYTPNCQCGSVFSSVNSFDDLCRKCKETLVKQPESGRMARKDYPRGEPSWVARLAQNS